ncbi:SOS response-associated peptidase [Leptothrix discophora]|uniref:Abasic site processing protein n=1 Tax=Leptothrix discophora TaxID=89 RepID=A0ABT9G7B9_LEPDI|nr:SOS response-associated peptidase family protein [Leptothrix discophora]MDP4302376.1 SOS response-associated peptidase family protein [Leptothrix discophora]
MCNLYQMVPKEDIERHFRALVGDGYRAGVVGPYGQGAYLTVRDGSLALTSAQWGLIAPKATTRRPASRSVLTNNARAESVAERWTYRDAWQRGQRCLIPASWYQEPNWETGKNIWWQLRRADGAPWALAGLWSEWTDPASGEIVASCTMLTCNCDGHPLLGRLHKPDPARPPDAQDKRAVVSLEPHEWDAWLHGGEADARALIRPAPTEVFDATVTRATDAARAAPARGGPAPSDPQGSLI